MRRPVPGSPLSRAERTAFATAHWASAFALLLWLSGEVAGRVYHLGAAPSTYLLNLLTSRPMVTSCCLGTFLVCWFTRPWAGWQKAMMLGIGLVLEVHLFQQRETWLTSGLPYRLLYLGSGLGAAAVLMMLVRLLTSVGVERQRDIGYLLLSIVAAAFKSVGGWVQALVTQSNPATYDPLGYALDGCLGPQPAFLVGNLVQSDPLLSYLCWMIYVHLPILLILAVLFWLRYPDRCYFNVMAATLIVGAVGQSLYHTFPMVGLKEWLGSGVFPCGVPPPVEIPPHQVWIESSKARNCMPSLHTSWILCVFLALRYTRPRWARALGWIGLIFTLMATLWLGHYLIDLVVAFPFTLFFLALTTFERDSNRQARRLCLAAGLGMTVLCYVVLKVYPLLVFMARNGEIFVSLALLTVIVSIALEARLARASLGFGPEESPPQEEGAPSQARSASQENAPL